MKLDVSLTDHERDAFLRDGRTMRLATVGSAGPHVIPLWFVWHDGAIWTNSTLGNVTLRNLERNPAASVTVDDGESYETLRGVVLSGPMARADEDPRLEAVEEEMSRKYHGGGPLPYRRWRDRTWLRLDPERVASWDFRKIPEARAKAAAS